VGEAGDPGIRRRRAGGLSPDVSLSIWPCVYWPELSCSLWRSSHLWLRRQRARATACAVPKEQSRRDRLEAARLAFARMPTKLAGLHVGAFWDPDDPALISLPTCSFNDCAGGVKWRAFAGSWRFWRAFSRLPLAVAGARRLAHQLLMRLIWHLERTPYLRRSLCRHVRARCQAQRQKPRRPSATGTCS
jgi:hypothetical protein